MDKYRPLNNMHSCRNSVFFCAGLRSSFVETLLAQNNDPAGYTGYVLKNAQEKQKLMVKALGYWDKKKGWMTLGLPGKLYSSSVIPLIGFLSVIVLQVLTIRWRSAVHLYQEGEDDRSAWVCRKEISPSYNLQFICNLQLKKSITFDAI